VRPLAVADVMRLPAFGQAIVVAGADGVGGQVTRVNVMQIPTADFARPDELVLTTTTAFDGAAGDLGALIKELADRGVAALAAHRHALDRLGGGALAVADRRRLPLIELPREARLNVVLHEVLERLVAEQTTQLEEDRRVRDHLADFALAGRGVDELPQAISELTGGEVAVADQCGDVLAASDEATRAHAEQLARAWLDGDWDEAAVASRGWIVWPVRGASHRLGCIVAFIPGTPEPIHRAVLEHGSTTAALAMLQLQAAGAEATRLREQFIHDLLGGSLEPDAVRERAELLGWDPREPYRVLLASDERGAAATLLDRAHEYDEGALAVEQEGACLAIVGSGPEARGAPADAAVADLAEALATHDGDVRIGISGMHTGMTALTRAVQEAAEMRATATSFPRQPVRWFDPMNPLRILALVPRDELVAFAGHVLGPLDGIDAARRQTLLETLDVLIATDLNVAATARRGGWHYNTVRYRIRRLTELLGPFVESGERLQSLTLALLIRRELTAARGVPEHAMAGDPRVGTDTR
jgi:purine catabolism regulator